MQKTTEVVPGEGWVGVGVGGERAGHRGITSQIFSRAEASKNSSIFMILKLLFLGTYL